MIRSLIERKLVRIAGHRDVPGKPMLYGTTRRFLEVFGLERLKDLPTLRELDELAREQGLHEKTEKDADVPAAEAAEEEGEPIPEAAESGGSEIAEAPETADSVDASAEDEESLDASVDETAAADHVDASDSSEASEASDASDDSAEEDDAERV